MFKNNEKFHAETQELLDNAVTNCLCPDASEPIYSVTRDCIISTASLTDSDDDD